ncbi:FAD-binding and (Fe-S)-binding domain-containing protein [Nocardiopsis suaedae]|uniref:FAD-binding and (Fe-S)-binding domain-containing protein n=1 Tax=Nocardiopsis suaedae TaxID=3018444 RepID=UPI0038CDBD09
MYDGLEEELEERVDGEVRFDRQARGAYSTDASNYRAVPIGVVTPRSTEAGAEAAAVCREYGAPVLSRGGGTSLAGQCTNTAVVIDWTRHCDRLVSVDEQARTCVVEPGIVLDELNRRLSGRGLMVGPSPSTHAQCTIGGMVGNDSCGASAQAYGRTADSVEGLEALTYGGLRLHAGPTGEHELERLASEPGARGELHRGLAAIRDRHADDIRDRMPRIPRAVSGYNLDALLGTGSEDGGMDTARLLVGTEGTLATVLRAELRLVPTVPATATAVVAYPDVVRAAHAAAEVAEAGAARGITPQQIEAVDATLVGYMADKGMHPHGRSLLPPGGSWLFLRFGGADADAAADAARDVLRGVGASPDDETVFLTADEAVQEELMALRESGLGATARITGRPDNWPGWEDSAVAPERLGDYLHDLVGLYADFGYPRPAFYGHFGHGCVHVRSPFDFKTEEGIAKARRFIGRAAELVAAHGGSLSGEHGDGQARGELLETVFGERMVRAFEETKAVFDPQDRMNPGKVVHPRPLDADLRFGAGYSPAHPGTFLGYPDDSGDFSRAVERCVGVGKCRRHEGGVMCPSYMVTGSEEHSTRGRARLLFEMLHGHDDSPVSGGWRSEAVRGALDLCLACKGCKSDCPMGVDMASYKAEFLAQHYRGRIRPAAHYSLGWLPVLARAARLVPRAANAVLRAPGVAPLGKRAAGVAPQREAPEFADETFRHWWRRRGTPEPEPGDPRAAVVWPDTFTDHFAPQIGACAVRVLEEAGFRVAVPEQEACCGLTWITTGQLRTARAALRRSMRALRPWVRAGTPVVGLEPSCTAVLRSDSAELFPHDEDFRRLRENMATFAEALVHCAPDGEWRPRRRPGRAIVQTHCHQHAVLGFDADRRLMREAGVDEQVLDSGCCGLAGDFGFTRGHYDVSMAVGERVLLPAVREADAETLVVADGFSCRTQIAHGTERRALHLAEVLDGREEPEPHERRRSPPSGPSPPWRRR